MNILLLSAGGGGGNILRSLKALFRRDALIAQKSDPRYAERLRRSVVPRFLDTNEFSLTDVPKEERVLIGAATTKHLGSRHNPEVARAALEDSKREIEQLLARYSAVVLIGTGGKGTGAGTMFPLAQMARQQRKLVIPIFVRPSFERHEVDKRRFDHARRVTQEFDTAGIRLIEILNDRGYVDSDPQPQSVIWERMNLPIARGLRGLLYVLSDLSQVDPSDLSTLFAGHGRLRLGYAEIDPSAGQEPAAAAIDQAVHDCWQNSYYSFDGHVGTSLVCIQGDWSNLVDARIKGRLAAAAMGTIADAPYNPLYARAFHTPRPWGVTALFAEHTGHHAPLEIDWMLEKRTPLVGVMSLRPEPEMEDAAPPAPMMATPAPAVVRAVASAAGFASFWEFAVALNHADPAALALASNGATPEFPIEASELKKLLGTFWFRSAFSRFSDLWRERTLEVVATGITIPNHAVKHGRHLIHASDLTYDQLKEVCSKTMLRGPAGTDLQLLLMIGKLWGAEAIGRLTFTEVDGQGEPSRIGNVLQRLLS